jgi:hypothetical protein
MLLLFALSVTPKQLLHDVVTGHTHTNTRDVDGDKVKTSLPGFQCNWNSEVVESPFNNHAAIQEDHPVAEYSRAFILFIVNYNSALHFFSSLRGPPSLA